MQTRRFKTIRGNVDLYFLLFIFAALSHLSLQEFHQESFFINTKAFSYLLVFFMGYKFGRLWGLLAGLLSTGVWLFMVLLYGNYSAFQIMFASILTGDGVVRLSWLEGVDIFYGSLQYVVVFGAIGYFSAFLIDKIEDFLSHRGLSVEDLVPRGKTLIVEQVGDWFKRLVIGLFLLQLNPEDKKGVIMRRIRKLFLVVIALPLAFLFNLFSLQLYLQTTDFLSISILPASLAPVVGLWIAYLYGVMPGVLITLSLILSPLAGLWMQEMLVSDVLNFRYGVSSPDAVVAFTALAWVIGKVSTQLNKKAISDKLFWSSACEEPNNLPRLKLRHIVLLALLTLQISFRFVRFEINLELMGVLIIYIVWLSVKFNYKQVSNVVLILFTVFSMVNMRIPLESEVLRLGIRPFHIFEVVMLALIPVCVSRTRLLTIHDVRSMMLWVLGISWVIYMAFLNGAYFPDFSVSWYIYSSDYYRSSFTLLQIIGTLFLFELGTRFLWFGIKKTPNWAIAG